MELKINLEGIFADEEGNDVNAAIKELIVSEVTDKIYSAVSKRMEEVIHQILTKGITERLQVHLDGLIPNLMDHEFTEVTKWGEKKGTYTVRNRILSALDGECVYKDGRYDSDKNAFSRAVGALVEQKMNAFKNDFNKQVDAAFTKEAFEYSQRKLSERLGIAVKQ